MEKKKRYLICQVVFDEFTRNGVNGPSVQLNVQQDDLSKYRKLNGISSEKKDN